MRSKWFDKKEEAIELRKQCMSIRKIEIRLGIPRSTLSGWFKDVALSPEQTAKIHEEWIRGLVASRQNAIKWHNEQKRIRLETAKAEASEVLSKINVQDKAVLELALAMLYWGEGFKKNSETGMGNSDPVLLNFFLTGLESIYEFDRSRIKPDLHLRADQNPIEAKKYWSNALDIPLGNFGTVAVDNRTVGRKTYPTYNGVCLLRLGNVAIQRRLLYIIDLFSQEVISAKRP